MDWKINLSTIGRFAACISLFALNSGIPCTAIGQEHEISMPPEKSVLITLEQVENEVTQHHPALRVQRLEFEQSKQDILTASLRQNPQLNVNGDVFPLPGEKYSPAEKQYGASIQFPIELGGKREFRIEAAEKASESSKYQFENNVRMTLLVARLAFHDLCAAYEQLDIARLNRETFHTLVDLNNARYAGNQISPVELSRSILALQQADLQVEEASLNINKANEALAAAVGYREKFVPRDSIAAIIRKVPALDSLLSYAVEHRPDLLNIRRQRLFADANRRLQEANGIMDISLGLDATMQQGVKMYGLSAQIPIPIFNRNQGERQKAELKIEEADRMLQWTELTVRTDVQAAYAEYCTRSNAVQKFLSKDGEGILERALNIKTAAASVYENGSSSLLEYLDAVRTSSDLFKAYIDAVTAYNKSIALLDAATGTDAAIVDYNE